MPNLLNTLIKDEQAVLLKEADNCVVVDFQGLTVEEANDLRSSLREKEIQMRVVKTALARLVLQEMEMADFDEIFTGPTAVVWGGESVVQISKEVHGFAKKNKMLKIKGGILESKCITNEDVLKLTRIPDMPVLLAGIAAGVAAPLQNICNGINSLLSSIANVIDAVKVKKEESGS